MLNDPFVIGEKFSNFYHELFTSINLASFDDCLNPLVTCISNDMNNLLVTKFNEAEVKEALFQMNPLGAPRPDSYLACFYQNN